MLFLELNIDVSEGGLRPPLFLCLKLFAAVAYGLDSRRSAKSIMIQEKLK